MGIVSEIYRISIVAVLASMLFMRKKVVQQSERTHTAASLGANPNTVSVKSASFLHTHEKDSKIAAQNETSVGQVQNMW